jgi:hypothetical protein
MSGYTQVDYLKAKKIISSMVPDTFSTGEIRVLAERFTWDNYAMHAETSRTTERGGFGDWGFLDRDTVLGLRENGWLRDNKEKVDKVMVEHRRWTCIEIHKGDDDWWWVIFNFKPHSVFEGTPLPFYNPQSDEVQFDLAYRCDQISGLLSLLEWAVPATVDKK